MKKLSIFYIVFLFIINLFFLLPAQAQNPPSSPDATELQDATEKYYISFSPVSATDDAQKILLEDFLNLNENQALALGSRVYELYQTLDPDFKRLMAGFLL